MGGMQRTLPVAALLTVLGLTVFTIEASGPRRLALQTTRSSPQDLEITGDLPGLAAGESRLVRYTDLAALPQVAYTVSDDPDFDKPVRLSGVSLETLVTALGFGAGKQLVAASSSDGYEGHYTAEHRLQHHPFLVLKIDGKEPAQWPRGSNGEVFTPYIVSYPHFKPLFHVLAQPEEAQLPLAVTKLRFSSESGALGALRPPTGAPTSAAQGYRIAVVNCLRCHRSGDIGGTKSPFGWPQMAMIAKGNAPAFGKYLIQPNRVNPEANMPPNPEFDAATVAAVTAYFQSEAP